MQASDVQELRSLRYTVPPVTEDTVMQKVISLEQFKEYTKEDGAIYKVDSNGNETMVGMWNHGHFEKVK